MAGPEVCEHGRTAAACEVCVHAAALNDPQRAPATRDELYPFPEGAALSTGFLHEDAEAAAAGDSALTLPAKPKAARRK